VNTTDRIFKLMRRLAHAIALVRPASSNCRSDSHYPRWRLQIDDLSILVQGLHQRFTDKACASEFR
jgi:hypothetical protein